MRSSVLRDEKLQPGGSPHHTAISAVVVFTSVQHVGELTRSRKLKV